MEINKSFLPIYIYIYSYFCLYIIIERTLSRIRESFRDLREISKNFSVVASKSNYKLREGGGRASHCRS